MVRHFALPAIPSSGGNDGSPARLYFLLQNYLILSSDSEVFAWPTCFVPRKYKYVIGPRISSAVRSCVVTSPYSQNQLDRKNYSNEVVTGFIVEPVFKCFTPNHPCLLAHRTVSHQYKLHFIIRNARFASMQCFHQTQIKRAKIRKCLSKVLHRLRMLLRAHVVRQECDGGDRTLELRHIVRGIAASNGFAVHCAASMNALFESKTVTSVRERRDRPRMDYQYRLGRGAQHGN